MITRGSQHRFRAGRRVKAFSFLASLGLVALTLPAGPVSADVSGSSASSPVTVTGPGSAYDPTTKQLRTDKPTATVAETENLVDQTVHVSWTGETPTTVDLDNPSDTAAATVDPSNLSNSAYGVGVYECAGAAPTSINACYLAIAGSTYGSGGLGNALYALTYPDGSGNADLHIETAVTNSTLGCDATHPCSVAVVPAWGGVQDGTDVKQCGSHKADPHGDGNALSRNIQTGFCAWANRLVVPLHFAPTPTDCPIRTPAFSALGSPMLQRAMTQWASGWCNDSSPLSFSYNSGVDEYSARESFLNGGGALTAATDVALTTQAPPTAPAGFTYAPLANTDIAVAFLVDDPKTRGLITDLNLNARLVAKLLTQSYAPSSYACLSGGDTTKQGLNCDPAVKGNPTSIFTDKEFLALNPQLSASDFAYTQENSVGGYFPTVVAGNSDLSYELTSWIASNADARAFLAGTPDPNGMHVNTYYKGVTYPTSRFEQLDPGYTDDAVGAIPGNGTMQNAWQPVTGLNTVGLTLVGDKASGEVGAVSAVCTPPVPCFFPKIGELPGHRSLFAILDQGQAAAYAFPVAHLINATGHPVAPTDASVAAGLAAATVNPDGITHRPNFAATDAGAYPLALTDYAMVRTCGQSAATASAVRAMLTKAAAAQVAGVSPGTLAPGYLALTTEQRTELTAAGTKVASAACPVAVKPATHTPPPTTHTAPATHITPATPTTHTTSTTPTTPTTPASQGGGQAGGNGATGNRPATSGVSGASKAATPAPTPAPVTVAPTSSAPVAQPTVVLAGSVRADRAGTSRFVLPVLLGVGAVLLLLGPGAYVLLMTGAGGAVAARLRRQR